MYFLPCLNKDDDDDDEAVNGTTGCWVQPSIKWRGGGAATHPATCKQEGWQQHTLVIMSNAMRVAATHPKSE